MLAVRSDEIETQWPVTVQRFQTAAFCRIPVEHAEHRCAACNSIVYSRRHKMCSVCGELLPAEAVFNSIEAHRIESLLSVERERHRQWLRRASA